MAKLVQVDIVNFRGIDKLSLSFRNAKGGACDVVVIGGPNGCGKTAVLEAILVATGNGSLARGAIGKAAIRSGATDSSISIRTEIGETLEARCDEKSATTKLSSVPAWCQLRVGYYSSWREPKLVGSLGITAGKRGRRPDKTEQNWLWRLKQYLINAWAKSFENGRFRQTNIYGEIVKNAYEEAISKLEQVWCRFYPGESLAVASTDESIESGFDVFLKRSSGEVVSVDQLSSGQQELLQMAAAFIVETEPIDLLIIDEPELHLDPAWHAQVIRALQLLAPQTQLIIATHSPQIYDSVMSFERHFLVNDDDPRARFWPHATGEEVA